MVTDFENFLQFDTIFLFYLLRKFQSYVSFKFAGFNKTEILIHTFCVNNLLLLSKCYFNLVISGSLSYIFCLWSFL